MPSKTIPTSILLYGQDQSLLETRQWILRRAGHTAHSTRSFNDLPELMLLMKVELLIFCHTLTTNEYARAAAMVHERWPEVQQLALVAGFGDGRPEATCGVVDTMQGPQKLVDMVAAMAALRMPVA